VNKDTMTLLRTEGNEIREKEAMERPKSLERLFKFDVTGY
jgi:hypothetical protein